MPVYSHVSSGMRTIQHTMLSIQRYGFKRTSMGKNKSGVGASTVCLAPGWRLLAEDHATSEIARMPCCQVPL